MNHALWVLILAIGFLLVGVVRAQPDASEMGPMFQRYTQTVRVRFASPAAATSASAAIAELPDGKTWAITARWDDNSPSNIRMAALMNRYGYVGTFYMNGRDRSYWGNAYEYTGPNREIDVNLVAAGQAIGGHGWQHQMLGYSSRNRMWREVLRVRADREASGDTPVNTFAMPYVNWTNPLEGADQVGADIARALLNAGYLHNANANYVRQSGVYQPAANLLPSDGAPVERRFNQYLDSPAIRAANPNISFSMHAPAYNTEAKWERLASQLAEYAGRDDWWYCSQNEYGAYRAEYLLGDVQARVDGDTMTLTVTRLDPRDLNAAVPLTLRLSGVSESDVVAIDADGADIRRNGLLVNLPHAGPAAPTTIGWIPNDRNEQAAMARDIDGDFADIEGRLWRDGNRLRLRLDNGAQPLETVRVTYRLPLAWQDRLQRREVGTIDADGRWDQTVALAAATDDPKFRDGSAAFGAQVDFVRDGQPGRIHLTVAGPDMPTAPSMPKGKFVWIGGIAPAEFSDAFAIAAANSGRGGPVLVGGQELHWQRLDAELDRQLDPEMIYAVSTNWEILHTVSLFRATVESDVEQAVAWTAGQNGCRLFVNGRKVEPSFTLSAGASDVMLVHPGRRARVIGFRLFDPATGDRLTNIEYRAVPLAPAAATPTMDRGRELPDQAH